MQSAVPEDTATPIDAIIGELARGLQSLISGNACCVGTRERHSAQAVRGRRAAHHSRAVSIVRWSFAHDGISLRFPPTGL